ncbi:MAG: gamma-butyrobetaine hydroxylase-like domain-containing protein [Phycisphaerales bacterium]
MDSLTPASIDLKKDRGLTIQWQDGSASYYSIAYLRRMSPSADMRQLREEMQKNPLTVLPGGGGSPDAVVATGAELVGNYALRIRFSDGHSTGIYSWSYLREIDPARQQPDENPTS